MTPQDLYTKYPLIFPKPSLWFGAGWLPLVDEACDYIQGAITSHSRDGTEYPQLMISFSKEKFGDLRLFYSWDLHGKTYAESQDFHSFMNDMSAVLSFTEYRSSKTCEETGAPGELYVSDTDESTGWYRTLCEAEATKRGFKKVISTVSTP